jgi:D-3-phosphoglycerate dehydrogenase
MARYKVLVTDHVFENFEQEEKALAGLEAELVVRQAKDAAELLEDVRDADAVLNTYLGSIDRRLFEKADRLRIVARYGIGVDTINVPDATEFGILVTNVPDYCVDEVANHALAHFLSLARKIGFSDAKVRDGQWSLSYVKPMKPLRTMTAGIVGLGKIGKAIAARLQPFGLNVTFSDPVVDEHPGARRVAFEQLLRDSDVIFVQCPANERTRHLFDREAFARMQRKPILVNTARGPIVETDALVEALQKGLVSAAGLDLLEDQEQVVATDHPLKSFDHVTLTPHSAWYSELAIPELQRRAAEEVARALRGEPPRSPINPEVLERKEPS